MALRFDGWGATAAKLFFTAGVLALGIQITGQPFEEQAVSAAAAPAPRQAKPVLASLRAPSPTPAPAADQAFVVKRILPIAGPLRFGDYHWDDADVPDGPLVVTVDLKAQTISVFRDGYEIGAASIIFGVDGKPTPLGAFPITQKDADHVSNIYDAPMPYMLRLTNDGVSIHGSDHVEWGSATRGCIGVPIAFAKLLFQQAKLGDIVIITDGKRLGVGEPIMGA